MKWSEALMINSDMSITLDELLIFLLGDIF